MKFFKLFSAENIPKKIHGGVYRKKGQNRRQTATYFFDPGFAGVSKLLTHPFLTPFHPWGAPTLRKTLRISSIFYVLLVIMVCKVCIERRFCATVKHHEEVRSGAWGKFRKEIILQG